MKINEVYKHYPRPDSTEKLVELNKSLLTFDNKKDSKRDVRMGRDPSRDRSIDEEIMELQR